MCGISFKENCPDTRNSKSIELIKILEDKSFLVDCYDPNIHPDNLQEGINLIKKPKINFYDVIIIAVGHSYFLDLGLNKIKKFGKRNSIIYDLKSVFNSNEVDGSL